MIRAIVLNDCSTQSHWGTRMVMNNLRIGAERIGIEIVRTYRRGFDRWDAMFDRVLERAELVLINGEGTCHHDAPDAARFFAGASRAHEKGVPVVLLNAVWQANPGLTSALRNIDLIYVRESASAADLERAGYHAVVVPDLSLAADLARVNDGFATGPVLVTDGVGYSTSLTLAEMATARGWAFRPMRRWGGGVLVRHPFRAVKIALASGGRVRSLSKDDLGLLQHAPLVVTGRYHGVCLAVLGLRPFLALRSNSHKVEAMAADMGLSDLVLDPGIATADHLLGRVTTYLQDLQDSTWSGEVTKRLHQYLEGARAAQDAMFRSIRALVSR